MKRIYATYFEPTRRHSVRDRRYERMAKVLGYSASVHCSDYETTIEQIHPPTTKRDGNTRGRNGLATNTDKLNAWNRVVENCNDGDKLVLLDADMMIVAPIDDVWDFAFDVALTNKRTSRLPFNGGAVYLRINDKSRHFMRLWRDVNERLYNDPKAHAPWRKKYGGMNQASLGYLKDTDRIPEDLRLKWLPCWTWNCCDDAMWRCPKDARIIHIKSGLRRSVFRRKGKHSMRYLHTEMSRLIEQWYAYERGMKSANAAE